MKPGTAFKLSVSVFPAEAEQAVSYKSTNTSVAAVSGSGVVTGKTDRFRLTIRVSKWGFVGAVSVIVNRDTEVLWLNRQQIVQKQKTQVNRYLNENTDVIRNACNK